MIIRSTRHAPVDVGFAIRERTGQRVTERRRGAMIIVGAGHALVVGTADRLQAGCAVTVVVAHLAHTVSRVAVLRVGVGQETPNSARSVGTYFGTAPV